MINRRFLLQIDPPVDWPAVFQELRSLGFCTADICFTLNIVRPLLWDWENGKSKPNFEHGRAVLKFLATAKVVRKSDTKAISLVA